MKEKILIFITALFICSVINAKEEVAKIQSLIEGRLIMCVEPGDRVVKGQPLFYVDPGTLIIQKEKNLNTIKYNFETVQRNKKLAKSHDVSLNDLQQSEYNLVTSIQDAKTTEQSILDSYYYAPFNGIVTKVMNYTGSAIGDSCEIVDVAKVTPKTDVKALENKVKKENQVAIVETMTEGMLDMHVKVGQYVKKGQLLFDVNTVPKVNDLTTYIGPQKEKFENAYEYYNKVYLRLKKLYSKNCVKLADFQLAEMNYKNALADLKSFNMNVKNSNYYSPFNGVITNITNYNGCIGDAAGIVEVTKVDSAVSKKDLQGKVKNKEIIAQIDPIIKGILDLKVKNGEHVRKGQLLYKIETSALENQKEKDLTNVKVCEDKYERIAKLASIHAVSLQELDDAKFNMINAVADLNTTKMNLKNSYYYAPFDGVVQNIVTTEDSAVGDGAPVLEIKKDKIAVNA